METTFLKEAKVRLGPQKNENGKINVSREWDGKYLYRNESSTNDNLCYFLSFVLLQAGLSVVPTEPAFLDFKNNSKAIIKDKWETGGNLDRLKNVFILVSSKYLLWGYPGLDMLTYQ